MAVFTRGKVWNDRQRFALMAGGFLTYAWVGFPLDVQLHGKDDLHAHAVLAGIMCLVLAIAGYRSFKSSKCQSDGAGRADHDSDRTSRSAAVSRRLTPCDRRQLPHRLELLQGKNLPRLRRCVLRKSRCARSLERTRAAALNLDDVSSYSKLFVQPNSAANCGNGGTNTIAVTRVTEFFSELAIAGRRSTSVDRGTFKP